MCVFGLVLSDFEHYIVVIMIILKSSKKRVCHIERSRKVVIPEGNYFSTTLDIILNSIV